MCPSLVSLYTVPLSKIEIHLLASLGSRRGKVKKLWLLVSKMPILRLRALFLDPVILTCRLRLALLSRKDMKTKIEDYHKAITEDYEIGKQILEIEARRVKLHDRIGKLQCAAIDSRPYKKPCLESTGDHIYCAVFGWYFRFRILFCIRF